MTIKKEDIDWDNFPAYVAGSSEKKTLSEADKEWFVNNFNEIFERNRFFVNELFTPKEISRIKEFRKFG